MLFLSVERLDIENFNRFIGMGIPANLTDSEGNNILHVLFSNFDMNPRSSGALAFTII